MSSKKVVFLFFIFALTFYFLPGFIQDNSQKFKEQWQILPARIDKLVEVLKTKL